MVKEISLSTDALVLSNGVVLKRYDKTNDCYDFKIISDVAIIRYNNGIIRAYGDFHNMEGVDLNSHINMIENPHNPIMNIPILIVVKNPIIMDKNDSKFDADVVYISDGLDDKGNLEGSYALSTKTKSGYPYSHLYVDWDSFNEESYREVKNIVSRNSYN